MEHDETYHAYVSRGDSFRKSERVVCTRHTRINNLVKDRFRKTRRAANGAMFYLPSLNVTANRSSFIHNIRNNRTTRVNPTRHGARPSPQLSRVLVRSGVQGVVLYQQILSKTRNWFSTTRRFSGVGSRLAIAHSQRASRTTQHVTYLYVYERIRETYTC